jgi:hypothetical protein
MSISSQTVTVAEATKTKVEVGNCRKELHAMVKRLSTMKRQLIAQKEYIEVAVKDALAELNSSPAETSPYYGKSISDKIVDYRVKLYKHRAFIGRLKTGGVINDMHADTPTGEMPTGYTRAIKSGGGLKVPIFNSSQILPGVTTSVDDPERIAETTDSTEVFNGVDIIGTKQFLIGVNSILTHPNNISETLVPSPYLNPAEEKRSYSTVWGDEPPHDVGNGFAQSMIGSAACWSPKMGFVAGQEWMKIELPSVKLVTGVVTQAWGFSGSIQAVKTLKVKTSIDDVAPDANGNKLSLVDSGKSFDANTLSALSTLKTIPFKQPVLAKYVIIYPQTYYGLGGPSMRAGVLVAPLEDTPYELMVAANAYRVFNTGTYPYRAGTKHELSTGVLKGLLMQGNENITGTASKTTILTAIPTDGTDSNNKDHFKKIRGFGLD